MAFSLGDLELKSNLGEPLYAKISINDTDAAAIDGSCFSVADISEVQAFKKSTTSLSPGNSNSLSLTITSSQNIYEPIVNLSVTYHCEPHVNREYVLLLDPAPIAESTQAKSTQPTAGETLNGTGASQLKPANPATNVTANNGEDIPSPPVKKQRSKKKKIPKAPVSIDAKLDQAYVGKADKMPSATADNTQPPEATVTNSQKPYLVISGDRVNAGENGQASNLALRMERQIDLKRIETGEMPLSNAEAMDEVTVMANRLAHLEKQILSLQSKNQQLQAEAVKAKTESVQISPAIGNWLRYLGIAALIILTLAAIEMLRRKLLNKPLKRAEPVWFDSEDDLAVEAEEYVDSAKQAAKFSPDPLFEDLAAPSTVVSHADNDEAESLLEHAEVFIAHGRPILAIQLLQNHLVDAPTQSPTIWLKLLSLLASEGSETEYDGAVIECNQFFNIKLPTFAEANKSDDSSIEDHPHIVNRLEAAWGSAFAITLLNDLIYNQHSQPREGFARGTFEELFFLKKIAEILQSSDTLAKSPHSDKPKLVSPVGPLAGAATVTAAASAALPSSQQDDDVQMGAVNADANTEDSAPPSVVSNDYALDYEPSTSLSSEANVDIDWSSNPIESSNEQDFRRNFLQADSPQDSLESGAKVSAVEQPHSNLESNTLNDQAENTEFETDFADGLEFDQVDLITPEAKLEIDPDEESNNIEFDWDLPNINKE